MNVRIYKGNAALVKIMPFSGGFRGKYLLQDKAS
jgi:hypothetical protein